MNIVYLLKQLIGLLGTVLFLLSFQFKENKKLFRIQLIAYLVYALHYCLIGAYTGGLSSIISAFRSVCLVSKKKFASSKQMCVCICLLQAATLLVTWNGFICILPVVANIASTIGNFRHNPKTVRAVAMFINSPLWIIYCVAVGSWAGIIDELITELSAIISVIRFGWKNLDKVEK